MASAESIRRERMKRVKAIEASQRNTLASTLQKRLHTAIESTVNNAANQIYVDAVKRAPQRKVFKGAGAGGVDRFGNPSISHGGRNQVRAAIASDLNFVGSTRAGKALAKAGSSEVVTRRSRIHGDNPISNAMDPSYLKERARARSDPDADFPNAREINVGTSGTIQGLSDARVTPALSARGRYELFGRRRDDPDGGIFSSSGGIDRQSSNRGEVTLGGRLKKEIRITPLMHKGFTTFRRVESPTRYAKYVEFGTRYAAAQPYMRPALAKQYAAFVDNLRKNLAKASSDLRQVSSKAETTGISRPARRNWARTRKANVGEMKVSRADIDALERVVRISGGGGFR